MNQRKLWPEAQERNDGFWVCVTSLRETFLPINKGGMGQMERRLLVSWGVSAAVVLALPTALTMLALAVLLYNSELDADGVVEGLEKIFPQARRQTVSHQMLDVWQKVVLPTLSGWVKQRNELRTRHRATWSPG